MESLQVSTLIALRGCNPVFTGTGRSAASWNGSGVATSALRPGSLAFQKVATRSPRSKRVSQNKMTGDFSDHYRQGLYRNGFLRGAPGMAAIADNIGFIRRALAKGTAEFAVFCRRAHAGRMFAFFS